MSVEVYRTPRIGNYIILINNILKNASREMYDDVKIKKIRNDAKELIRIINQDGNISDEIRAVLPSIPEFKSLIDFANRKLYASPYEEGYFVPSSRF